MYVEVIFAGPRAVNRTVSVLQVSILSFSVLQVSILSFSVLQVSILSGLATTCLIIVATFFKGRQSGHAHTVTKTCQAGEQSPGKEFLVFYK